MSLEEILLKHKDESFQEMNSEGFEVPNQFVWPESVVKKLMSESVQHALEEAEKKEKLFRDLLESIEKDIKKHWSSDSEWEDFDDEVGYTKQLRKINSIKTKYSPITE